VQVDIAFRSRPLPQYGSTVASMRRADSSLRRPPGSRRTPARSSASVMDVIAALSTPT